MPAQDDTLIRDATPLYDAARSLHGYFLFRWLREYLNVALGNIQRWSRAGLLGSDGRPNAAFRQCLVDFNALDLEILAQLCGLYFYIHASHKKANHALLRQTAARRVLYLRGFDYQAAVGVGGGVAMGIGTVDSTRFNHRLGALLGHDCEVYKALGPLDLERETQGLEGHFYGNYRALIRHASAPLLSFFLHAGHWQGDIAHLAGRMDYFVVYLSSLSDSVLWELQHLLDHGHAGRTTVIFDRDAILTKNLHAGFYAALPGLAIGKALWLPDRKPLTEAHIDAFRAELETHFSVIPAADFDARADTLRTRILAARGPLPPGQRESSLPFRFHPALAAPALAALRRLDAALAREVDAETDDTAGSPPPDGLPFRLGQLQLRVFTALALGDHPGAARALAAYAGCMDALLAFYTRRGQLAVGLPANELPAWLGVFRDHLNTAASIARHFLEAGPGDRFEAPDDAAYARLAHCHTTARQQADACIQASAAASPDGLPRVWLPPDVHPGPVTPRPDA